MIIYGVDPGASGAIAMLNNNDLVTVIDMPTRVEGITKQTRRVDAAGLADEVRRMRGLVGVDGEICIIEKVSAMPGQGVSSMFSLGFAAGVAEAVFVALGIRVEYVSPKQWKKEFGLGSDKSQSRGRASLLFPGSAGTWSRVKDDGRAEAVLMALYGKRKFY